MTSRTAHATTKSTQTMYAEILLPRFKRLIALIKDFDPTEEEPPEDEEDSAEEVDSDEDEEYSDEDEENPNEDDEDSDEDEEEPAKHEGDIIENPLLIELANLAQICADRASPPSIPPLTIPDQTCSAKFQAVSAQSSEKYQTQRESELFNRIRDSSKLPAQIQLHLIFIKVEIEKSRQAWFDLFRLGDCDYAAPLNHQNKAAKLAKQAVALLTRQSLRDCGLPEHLLPALEATFGEFSV